LAADQNLHIYEAVMWNAVMGVGKALRVVWVLRVVYVV